MSSCSSCNGGADVWAMKDSFLEGFLESPDQAQGSESGRLHHTGLYCGVVGSRRLVPRGVALMGFLIGRSATCASIAYSLSLV